MSRHSRPILQRTGMQSFVGYGTDVTLLSTVAPIASKTISSVFRLHNISATRELSVNLDGQRLRHVNVNLYSASSQKVPLMRSICRVLIKKTRLQCTTKTVNMHVRLTQIVLEQVPCRWSSDSEGATAVSIELKRGTKSRWRLAERR